MRGPKSTARSETIPTFLAAIGGRSWSDRQYLERRSERSGYCQFTRAPLEKFETGTLFSTSLCQSWK